MAGNLSVFVFFIAAILAIILSVTLGNINAAIVTITAIPTVSDNAAGQNTEIQYNNNGTFGASPYFTFDGNDLRLSDTKKFGLGTKPPLSGLDVTNSIGFNITLVTNDYTIQDTDYILEVDSNTTTTLLLPAASSSNVRRSYIVSDKSGHADMNNIIIRSVNGGFIDNCRSTDIYDNFGSVTLHSDGTQWVTSAKTHPYNGNVSFLAQKGSAVIAHRFGWLSNPVYDITDLLETIKQGVEFIECDVNMTSDGNWCVIHDTDLVFTTGVNAEVLTHTADQIRNIPIIVGNQNQLRGQGHPMLEDVWNHIKPFNVSLYIENKSGFQMGTAQSAALLSYMQNIGLPPSRCAIDSFFSDDVNFFKDHGYTVKYNVNTLEKVDISIENNYDYVAVSTGRMAVLAYADSKGLKNGAADVDYAISQAGIPPNLANPLYKTGVVTGAGTSTVSGTFLPVTGLSADQLANTVIVVTSGAVVQKRVVITHTAAPAPITYTVYPDWTTSISPGDTYEVGKGLGLQDYIAFFKNYYFSYSNNPLGLIWNQPGLKAPWTDIRYMDRMKGFLQANASASTFGTEALIPLSYYLDPTKQIFHTDINLISAFGTSAAVQAVGSSTFTDSALTSTLNQWQGMMLIITTGPGQSQRRMVASNTAGSPTVFTLTQSWTTALAIGNGYNVGFAANRYFINCMAIKIPVNTITNSFMSIFGNVSLTATTTSGQGSGIAIRFTNDHRFSDDNDLGIYAYRIRFINNAGFYQIQVAKKTPDNVAAGPVVNVTTAFAVPTLLYWGLVEQNHVWYIGFSTSPLDINSVIAQAHVWTELSTPFQSVDRYWAMFCGIGGTPNPTPRSIIGALEYHGIKQAS